MTVTQYWLTAEQDALSLTESIVADDDSGAMYASIAFIMNAAHANPSGPWGRGAINLLRNDGHVVAKMEAKANEEAGR